MSGDRDSVALLDHAAEFAPSYMDWIDVPDDRDSVALLDQLQSSLRLAVIG